MAESTVVIPDQVLPARRERHSREQTAVFNFLARHTGKTLDSYKAHLDVYLTWCESWDINPLDITGGELAMCLRHLQTEPNPRARNGVLAESSVAGRWGVVHQFLECAEIDDLIPKNTAKKVKRPKVHPDQQHQPYFDIGEAHSIVARAHKNLERAQLLANRSTPGSAIGKVKAARLAKARQDYAIIVLFSTTGIRVGGMCSLNVDSLTFGPQGPQLDYICKGRERMQPVLAIATYLALHDHIGERTTGPMFINRKGNRMTRYNVTDIINRICRQAGIEKHGSPHMWRRTYITTALQLNLPPLSVQRSVGHKQLSTTMRYDQEKDGGTSVRLAVTNLLVGS